MASIEVFEDPWPRTRKNIPLREAAHLHLQVSDFFLKLLAHFPLDDDGRISDDALVYSEWRYIVYIRFLQRVGLSPHEVPPPWDVAIIWYCHLMSTIRFHNHLVNSGHTAYGLYFNQFPLLQLSSLINRGKWSHRKGESEWNSFVKKDGYKLPYQLWSHTPWEEAPRGLGRLFRKQPTSESSRRLSKVSDMEDLEKKFIHIAFNPQLRGRCVLESPRTTQVIEKLTIGIWSLEDYTECRSRPLPACKRSRQHEIFRERCNLVEFSPWPTIQDTKTALYRQVAFWTALSKAQTSHPGFTKDIIWSEKSYANFMSLFRHRSLRVSQLDPHAPLSHAADSSSTIRLVPPTLEVDLLWHTHRLHPGSYWPYCQKHSLRLIDAVPAPSTDYVHSLYASTQERWVKWLQTEFPVTSTPTTEWTGVYTPETAVAVGPEQIRRTMDTACMGWLPYRRRRVPAGRSVDSGGGGGGGGMGGDSGPGCGGDGGGGGGGGGDGGG